MEKAYKFRLCPTAKHEELIRKTIGCSRFVYNQTLAARKGAYASGKSRISQFEIGCAPSVGHTMTWIKTRPRIC